jgi:glycosyltransferase involved in cell wall biosynthesis
MPSLLYIALYDQETAPGVHRKVQGFVEGAIEIGYSSESFIISPDGVKSYLAYLYKLLFAQQSIVVVRYLNRLGIFYLIAGLVLKYRGKKLYIDVPTPIVNLFHEIRLREQKRLVDWLDLVLICLQASLPFLSATKIIQYASEGRYFYFGARSRIIKIGNGINVNSIPARKKSPLWPANELNLIAVGTIAYWHGLDRLIKAINIIQDHHNTGYSINLKIVGDGPGRDKLEDLSAELGLTDNIRFLGMLHGDELFREYENIHLGVGSLGWFRSGVEEASPLKTREYLAVGMPTISATLDPDFDVQSDFYLMVSNDEDIESIVQLLIQLKRLELPSSQQCRTFALEHLNFVEKVRFILS